MYTARTLSIVSVYQCVASPTLLWGISSNTVLQTCASLPPCEHKGTIWREVNWWDTGACLQAMKDINETSLILHFNVSRVIRMMN
jgi:hypothetical protein